MTQKKSNQNNPNFAALTAKVNIVVPKQIFVIIKVVPIIVDFFILGFSFISFLSLNIGTDFWVELSEFFSWITCGSSFKAGEGSISLNGLPPFMNGFMVISVLVGLLSAILSLLNLIKNNNLFYLFYLFN